MRTERRVAVRDQLADVQRRILRGRVAERARHLRVQQGHRATDERRGGRQARLPLPDGRGRAGRRRRRKRKGQTGSEVQVSSEYGNSN